MAARPNLSYDASSFGSPILYRPWRVQNRKNRRRRLDPTLANHNAMVTPPLVSVRKASVLSPMKMFARLPVDKTALRQT